MQFNSKMGYSGNEQDYQLVKTSISELKKYSNQKEILRYLTNVLPNPTDVVTLDNAQNTVKSVKAQLANKNLIPYPYDETTKTQSGITFTDNGDGSITISGKAERDAYFRLCIADFGDKPISAITANSATNGIYTASKRLYYNNISKVASINILSGATVDETIYPQIELGTTATAYTPYISDFSTVKVTRCGKNFFNKDMSFTDDNKVTDGAAADYLTYFIQLQPNTKYYAKCFAPVTTDVTVTILSSNKSVNSDVSKGINLSRQLTGWKTESVLTTDDTGRLYIGNNANNLNKIKEILSACDLQIEKGVTATEYEPYQGQTYTPKATGEVTGITVLTPTTNITNDKGLLFTKVVGDDFNYIS